MALPEYITINGTNYATVNLNDAAKMQATNIQVVDEELARLHRQVGIAQTARNTYVAALIEAVRAKDEAPAAEPAPKKPRAPRKAKAKAKAE